MAIPSRQIGWGTTDNLLWQISKQLENLTKVTAASSCCSPTTTSTTTSNPTVSTTTTNGGGITAWLGYSSSTVSSACNSANGQFAPVYSSVSTLVPGTFLYTDIGLTQYYTYSFGFNPVAIDGVVWEISQIDGSIVNPQNCSDLVAYSFNLGYWNTTTDSCNTTQAGQVVVYSASETLTTGSFIFYDAALTNPVMNIVVAVGMTDKFRALSGGYLQSYTCPVQYRVGAFSYQSFSEACQNTSDLASGTYFYGQGDAWYGGTQLYSDSNLNYPINLTGWFPATIGWPSGSNRGMFLNNGVMGAALPC